MGVEQDHNEVPTSTWTHVFDGIRAWVHNPQFRGAPLAALLMVLYLAGALAPLDQRAWVARWSLDPTVSRAASPVVLAIDAPTIDLLGPPPWSYETWAEISRLIQIQGIEEPLLVDPWPLLLRADSPLAATEPSILVPQLTWWSRELPSAEHLGPPLLPVPVTLSTPPSPGHRWTTASSRQGEGSWLPCAIAGACPRGTAPAMVALREGDIAVVSMADVLQAEAPFLAPIDTALIALTAEPWATELVLAPADHRVPWGEAVATLLGSANTYGASLPSDPRLTLSWLLAWFALSTLALAAQTTRGWLTVAPLVAVLMTVVVERATGVLYPPVTTALLAIAPSLSREISRLQTSIIISRRMGLLVLRAATRAGMLRRAIRTPQDLTSALADLTRSHLGNRAFCHLHRTPRTQRLVWSGGYGIDRGDLHPTALTLRNRQLAEFASTEHGGILQGLLRDPEVYVHVVPMRQGGELVGYWVVQVPDASVDLQHLGNLALWINECLALESAPDAFGGAAGLIPENPWDDTLERLFRSTETERLRWLRCIRALGTPILVADATGVVNDINPAMVEALKRAGLPRVRSIRETLYHLDGEDRLSSHTARLFGEGLVAELEWPASSGRARLHIAPVRPETGEDERTYGFIGWVAESVDEASSRAQEDRIRHWTSTLEQRFSTVVDAAEALGGQDSEARRNHMVRFLQQQMEDLETDLQNVGDADRTPEAGPLDIVRVLKDESHRMAHLLQDADVDMRWHVPSEVPLAWAVAWPVQQGARALMEAATSLVRPHSHIQVSVAPEHNRIQIRIEFEGTADELIRGLREDAPLDSVPAEVRSLAQARNHLERLRIATDNNGRVTITFPLPDAGVAA